MSFANISPIYARIVRMAGGNDAAQLIYGWDALAWRSFLRNMPKLRYKHEIALSSGILGTVFFELGGSCRQFERLSCGQAVTQ